MVKNLLPPMKMRAQEISALQGNLPSSSSRAGDGASPASTRGSKSIRHPTVSAGVQEQGSAKAASERENEAPTGTPDADQSASRDEQRLLKLLSDRGVKGRTAKELVAKHPNRIQRQVAVYDWIQKKEPHRIDGDGQGFLVASIRDDYTPPPAFITADDLAEKEADKREAQQILLAEYEQDVEKLLGWLKDWEQFPPEKRINFQMLDQWIRDFRRRSKRNPKIGSWTEHGQGARAAGSSHGQKLAPANEDACPRNQCPAGNLPSSSSRAGDGASPASTRGSKSIRHPTVSAGVQVP